MKKSKSVEWNEDCSKALEELKAYLSTPPLLVIPQENDSLYLYLAVFSYAVSSALVCERTGIQDPVYYASKILLNAEQRYLPLEKLAFTLVVASRKLKHYFESHSIIILTSHPLKAVLRKANMSGRLSKWSVELGRFDIQFQPRNAIKGRVLVEFLAEFTGEHPCDQLQPIGQREIPSAQGVWRLFVDGASNSKGAGVGIVLVTPEDAILEQGIRLGFEASNNKAEYEALIAGLQKAQELGAKQLQVFGDSQLVSNQIRGDFNARDERMAVYLATVKKLMSNFEQVSVQQFSRGQNSHADALAALSSAINSDLKRTISIDFLAQPSIN